MDSDSRFVIWMVGIIAFVVISVAVTIGVVTHLDKQLFVSSGYVQTTVIGYNGYVWAKPPQANRE